MGEVRPQVGVMDGVEGRTSGQRPPVGRERGHGQRPAQRGRPGRSRVAEAIGDRGRRGVDDAMRTPRGRAIVGSPGRVRPTEQQSDRQRLGSGVLAPPFEDADRQGAALEVAGDDRGQLLADEPHAQVVVLGLERLPGPREQGVVGARADGQVPAPGREHVGRRSQRGQDGGARGAIRPADEDGESICRDRLEPVVADLQVPARGIAPERASDAPRAQAAHRDTGPLAVIDERHVDAGSPDIRTGHADPAPPGDRRDGRPA